MMTPTWFKLIMIGSLLSWLALAQAQTTFIPDIPLLNQDGEPVQFYTDLVKGKTVAMNFVFTSCAGVCPLMGAQFGQLQTMLGEQAGKDVFLISVSIDPVVDTPAKLKAWGKQFAAGPGWTLVTGSKRNIDTLLKTLEVFSADKNEHAPLALIGDETNNQWQRVSGLTSATTLADMLKDLATSDAAAKPNPRAAAQPALRRVSMQQPVTATATTTNPPSQPPSAAQRYFTDVTLINQHNQTMRLYTDLLQDKVVIINTFFSTCESVCPVTLGNLQQVQTHLGERLGKTAHILSFTVDPTLDTPEQLRTFAEKLQVKPGWFLLTGDKPNLTLALQKLGQWVDDKDSHSTVFIMGNERTGLWKKVMGMAPTQDIIQIVDTVLNDNG